MVTQPAASASADIDPISRQAWLTLFGGALAGLNAGTNYLFGAYGPQLQTRLGLTVTQANIVGASGNLGMYLTGTIAGPIIDRKGPSYVLRFSAVAMVLGWGGMWWAYRGGSDGIYGAIGLPGLAFAQMLTGLGSSTGIGSATNGTARSFTLRRRATALSVIFCCTGLSAFVYSQLYHAFFQSSVPGIDSTSSLLLMIMIGATCAMTLASILVRPALYPTGHSGPGAVVEIEVPESQDEEDEPVNERTRLTNSKKEVVIHEDVYGWRLVKTYEFWLIFFIESLLSGIGLMYINNLGVIIHTLSPSPPPSAQTSLVSLLSLCNASGRLLIGYLSDRTTHHKTRPFERIWWTTAVSLLFLVSQIWIGRVDQVEGWAGLAPVTVLTGTSYGFLFGLLPVLTLDWFGLKRYSSNNGIIVTGIAISGQTTNYLFGRIYDSHPQPCFGKECYAGALSITQGMAVLAFVISVLAGFRRRWMAKQRGKGYVGANR